MTHTEMVALIQAAISPEMRTHSSVWADMGAGSGNFTRALAELLGPQSVIHAVDQATLPRAEAKIVPLRGDFTRPLTLPPLDGILMANALHFVKANQQATVLRQLAGYLRPRGRFVLVEYALDAPLSYVPHPVSFARFEALSKAAGLTAPAQIGLRRSPSGGTAMYSALCYKLE